MRRGIFCAICRGGEGELVSAHLGVQHMFHIDCLRGTLFKSRCLECPVCSGQIDNPAAHPAFTIEIPVLGFFKTAPLAEIRKRIRLLMYCKPDNWDSILISLVDARRADGVKLFIKEFGPFEGGEKVEAVYAQAMESAVDGGQEDVLRALLEGGVSPSINSNFVLLTAINKGSLSMVRMLVEHGACLHTGSPLIFAKTSQQASILEYLLSASPDLKYQYSKGLLQAVTSEKYDPSITLAYVRNYLANMRDEDLDMEAPLYQAAVKGKAEMVKLLLDAGADPCHDDHKTLWDTLKNKYFYLYKLLMASPQYRLNPIPDLVYVRKLIDLIHLGAYQALVMVLDGCPTLDINYVDGTLLNMACRSGDIRMVGAFLGNGARVTDVCYEIVLETGNSQDILSLLIHCDKKGLYEKYGGRMVAMSRERTNSKVDGFARVSFSKTASLALPYAVADGSLEALDDLLYLGADINYGDAAALSMAMEEGYLDMARILVFRGADATVAACKASLKITDDIFVFLAQHAQLDKLWKTKLTGLQLSLPALRKALNLTGSKGNISNLKVVLDLWKPRTIQLDDIQELLNMRDVENREELLRLLLQHSLTI